MYFFFPNQFFPQNSRNTLLLVYELCYSSWLSWINPLLVMSALSSCPLHVFSLLSKMPFQVVLAFFLPPTHDPSLHLLTSPLSPPWPIPPGYIELCVTSTLLPPDSPISVFLCSVDPVDPHVFYFKPLGLLWGRWFNLVYLFCIVWYIAQNELRYKHSTLTDQKLSTAIHLSCSSFHLFHLSCLYQKAYGFARQHCG